MELKDFIKDTIASISEAILESQKELSTKGVLVNPELYSTSDNGVKSFGRFKNLNKRHLQTLEFDVLVGIDSENGGKKGGNIKVASFIDIGASKTNVSATSNQSRIKFEIPVAFSTVEVPEKYNGEELIVK